MVSADTQGGASGGSQPLTVRLDEVDGYPLVVPVGEIDIASVGVLQQALDQLLEPGPTRLVLDLEGVQYLDSTGLGAITASRGRAREEGGDVVVVCTRARILRLFAITGLDRVFSICASRDEAVAALAAGEAS